MRDPYLRLFLSRPKRSSVFKVSHSRSNEERLNSTTDQRREIKKTENNRARSYTLEMKSEWERERKKEREFGAVAELTVCCRSGMPMRTTRVLPWGSSMGPAGARQMSACGDRELSSRLVLKR